MSHTPTQADKPRVKYDANRGYAKLVNGSILLYPIDHPSERVTNKHPALTTKALHISDDGVIETLNTIYEPE